MDKTIPLINSSHKIIVDPEDYPRLAKFVWRLNSEGKPCRKDNRGNIYMMSRDVMKLVPGDTRLARYVNRDFLDNRKKNFNLSKPRIDRRRHKSSKGHIWPGSARECRSFIDNCKKDELAKIQVVKEFLLDLIENAEAIQWRIKNIIFFYKDLTYIDKEKSIAMFTRFLHHYFDWQNRFDIKPVRKKEEEVKKPDTKDLFQEKEEDDDDEIILPVVDEPTELTPVKNKAQNIHYRVEPLNLEDVKLENLIAEIKRRGVDCKIVF